MTDKNIRDEIAELAGAVRDLRDREVADEIRELRAEVEKLRAERAGHSCHGCHHAHCNWGHCGCYAIHMNTYPLTGTVTQPWYYTVSGGTGIGTVTAANYYQTSGATPTIASN